jgi:dihydroorotase/N-acyl-D-amino-acid deacylase
VTTVIGGPDGRSPLPIENTFERLAASPATVNYGTFVGHGTVRSTVVGDADRVASDEELQAMRDEVERAMQSGAFGLSSGLLYAPGSFAPTEEVIELATVAARHNGIYISHMRNEALGVLESVRETIRIARGLDITIDQYPYTASSTGLPAVFPRWSLAGGNEALRSRLADPKQRAKVREGIVYAMINERGGNDPANVVLANCRWDPSLNGLNLTEVLKLRNTEVTMENAAELVMDLQSAGGCSAVYHGMSMQDVDRIMLHPKTMIASDGGIIVPGVGVPHPRNYGTFARVLGHFSRERGLLPLSSAIHKMTRMPADRIGLAGRGRIEIGAFADISVFDAAKIIDTATFEEPHLVNGTAVLLEGRMTGARPGRVLRSQ